jgi:hypothetical protein
MLFSPAQSHSLPLQSTEGDRSRYLGVISGIVDFFRSHQDAHGAIIDPYTHGERQYSTPAFALAAAILVTHGGRADLLLPAAAALTCAVADLAGHTTADGHPDFYIPLIMHARRLLLEHVPAASRDEWDRQLKAITPQDAYRDTDGRSNWNLVNVAGECLRGKDGLVSDSVVEKHRQYIEASLAAQERFLTVYGMYEDDSAPLAYDAFPRLWMEDVLADGAYRGAHQSRWEEFLTAGGLSTLLLLSPSGEWPCGGRSAHHQWNEAQIVAICEMNAVRWKKRGNADIAGAFKRTAHLAFESVRRWRRPTGELSIVKNWADPAQRHGFEVYSYHSQYNLLAAAMLAIAYLRADDSIAETGTASERGSYLFEVKAPFRKLFAVAGGIYAAIDLACDPHYTATGLLRVHGRDVARSAYSDNTCSQRNYGPDSALEGFPMSPGITWGADAASNFPDLRSLARCARQKHGAGSAADKPAETAVLHTSAVSADTMTFQITYVPDGDIHHELVEEYSISGEGVEVTSRLVGDRAPAEPGILFPLLVSDGAADTQVSVNAAWAEVRLSESVTCWEVLEPAGVCLRLCGPRVPCHNGWMTVAWSPLPAGASSVRWRVRVFPPDG